MMHVVICDDEPCFQEAVVNAVKKWMCTSGHSDIRCTVFSSSDDLLERWSNGLSIVLLFLDIEIPGEISGMALASFCVCRQARGSAYSCAKRRLVFWKNSGAWAASVLA